MTREELRRELDRLCAWAGRWGALACKYERNRLQSRQDRIDHRARLANNKVRAFIAQHANTTGAQA